MKMKLSKTGIWFATTYLFLHLILLLMFPFSMGFSWLLNGMLSMPWNSAISNTLDLQYGEMNGYAVIIGIIVNTGLLYGIGYALAQFLSGRSRWNR